MSVTTVFLDLYHTLAHFYPPREQRAASALAGLGFQLPLVDLQRAYLVADVYYTQANQERPLNLMAPEEKARVYVRFHEILLKEVGLGHVVQLAPQFQQGYSDIEREFQLFSDVEPALAQLKSEGYRLGLITNIDSDPAEYLGQTGLNGYLDLVVASCLVGYDKPDPRIFHYALDAAGAAANEAVHVGDLLCSDVAGAQAAGIKAVLLDRYDLQVGLHPYRITSLDQLPALLRDGLS